MPQLLKNLSGFPLDVPTTTGPMLLPAYGELTCELGALDAEVMRQSPYVEITEGDEAKSARVTAPAADADDIKRLRGEYTELAGKKPFAGWKADRLQAEIDKLLA